jgi:hypothetical protein
MPETQRENLVMPLSADQEMLANAMADVVDRMTMGEVTYLLLYFLTHYPVKFRAEHIKYRKEHS